MIDISNWKCLYKIYKDRLEPTNLLYTPFLNPEETIMCMVWDEESEYQTNNTRLTSDVINFFFKREVRYLDLFEDYKWAPTIIDVDFLNRRIYLEWNNNTVNKILFTPGMNLDEECPNWREQQFKIIKDIYDEGYFKMSLYPHCFFVDKDKILRPIDFYACVSRKDPYLEKSQLEGMIGTDSGGRFDEATEGDRINFETFFENTLKYHLGKTWADNPFPEYYERLRSN